MDDLFDVTDPLDLASPFGLAVAVGVVLDEDERDECACWCPCANEVDEPDEICDACVDGQHEDEDEFAVFADEGDQGDD